MLFADLRRFTAYSNSVTPERVISALNAFQAAVGPLIDAQGGTLERFLGDGQVLICEATARDVSKPIQKGGPFELKGIPIPVPAFELVYYQRA